MDTLCIRRCVVYDISGQQARNAPIIQYGFCRHSIGSRSKNGEHEVTTLKRSAADLVAEAEAQVTTFTPAEVLQQLEGPNPPVLVDIRDVRELSKLGKIANSIHAPRGMLEFWVDPDSPYHRDVFSHNDKFVLYCAAGWRSALATKTLQDMGLSGVAHMAGGFTAWTNSGLPVEQF